MGKTKEGGRVTGDGRTRIQEYLTMGNQDGLREKEGARGERKGGRRKRDDGE